MRASQNGSHELGGKHISGGEQIATYENLQSSINDLLEKALNHARGKPDFLQIQFDLINQPMQILKPLPIVTNQVESQNEGLRVARDLLSKAGVPLKAIKEAFLQIERIDGNSGAILFDILSNQCVFPHGKKSIRVSRMDWSTSDFKQWASYYNAPLSHRLKEALVLATKVNRHQVTVAELCWSDDPDYTTGYVASEKIGYQRITKLKEIGDEHGCRIFFINGINDLETYVDYLESQPVFIEWTMEK